jgi:chloramphenicol 3-O-phosphotransferase
VRQLGPAVIVLTGVMAAGKSTVAQLLAEQLEHSVHVRGDTFRRMVVNGRAEPEPEPSAEAQAQLRLRYRASAAVADLYARDGWSVVVQDVILGEHVTEYLAAVTTRPRYLIVLAPSPASVAAREGGRPKVGYGEGWTIEELDAVLRRETPRRGLWLDTSDHAPDDTVAEILARLDEARIGD